MYTSKGMPQSDQRWNQAANFHLNRRRTEHEINRDLATHQLANSRFRADAQKENRDARFQALGLGLQKETANANLGMDKLKLAEEQRKSNLANRVALLQVGKDYHSLLPESLRASNSHVIANTIDQVTRDAGIQKPNMGGQKNQAVQQKTTPVQAGTNQAQVKQQAVQPPISQHQQRVIQLQQQMQQQSGGRR